MASKRDQRVLTSWVLVERDADASEDLWVSHCLEIDVVSQGKTIAEAMAMLAEAVGMAVCDDLAAGLDPAGRGKAPQEQWDKLFKVLQNGTPVKISEVKDRNVMLATQITLSLDFIRHIIDQPIPADRIPSYASNDCPVAA